MKKIAVLLMLLISMAGFTACEKNFPTSGEGQAAIENGEKMYDDIAAEHIRFVNISGNAKSIIIKQGTNNYFEFYNADLNPEHTYDVRCDENGDTLDINIMMENAEPDNNVLGSAIVHIPQKEFEKIEAGGEFSQVHLYAINSDVSIHANDSNVALNLESGRISHDITLEGSESNTFRSVSVYFDKLPANIKMELNINQNGTVNDPQDILQNNSLEIGSGKPVIRINHTNEINIYTKE